MYIKSLKINNLRNLKEVELTPNSAFNLFHGANGSGKTSLLEAIFLLATGRSFRTHQTHPIIRFGEESSVVHILKASFTHESCHKMGISRSFAQGLKLKFNNEDFTSLSQWVKHLPLQLIDAQSYNLLDAEPDFRRQFLDWIMFHVEPSFAILWQRYKRCLQQRNAALKEYKLTKKCHYQAWDAELIENGAQITQIRRELINEWQPLFIKLLSQFLQFEDIVINFKSGWNDNCTFAEALTLHYEKDQALGYTTQGVHRADLEFFVDNVLAKQLLSRGQSKLFVAALLISRAAFFTLKTAQKCVLLIDDLCSELDQKASSLLLMGLKELGGQIFITSIEKERVLTHLKGSSLKMFHVEQGQIIEKLEV